MIAVGATDRHQRWSEAIAHNRVVAATALAAAALFVAGCSSGQIAQTATQVAAVNGNQADIGSISLRDVRVLYPNSQEYTNSKGGKAAVAFSAINNSESVPDKIEKIATDVGTVTITPAGDTELKPQRTLVAGAATETDESAKPAESATADPEAAPILVEITDLKQNLYPGLTVPVTFTFEQAGDVEVQIPIDAGPDTERHQSDKSGLAEGEGSHAPAEGGAGTSHEGEDGGH